MIVVEPEGKYGHFHALFELHVQGVSQSRKINHKQLINYKCSINVSLNVHVNKTNIKLR